MALAAVQSPPRYAVLYCLLGETPSAGSLTVSVDQLLLEGGVAVSPTTLSIDISELREVRIARAPAERLNGHAVLVLDRVDEDPICVAPLGPGLLHEIADMIASFATPSVCSNDRITVVVPLKPGMQARVRQLVAAGPPLDPAELGLKEHVVTLHDDTIVFDFSGHRVREKIERAAHRPTLWRAGLAWRSVIDGGPQLTTSKPTLEDGEILYSWRGDGSLAPPRS